MANSNSGKKNIQDKPITFYHIRKQEKVLMHAHAHAHSHTHIDGVMSKGHRSQLEEFLISQRVTR